MRWIITRVLCDDEPLSNRDPALLQDDPDARELATGETMAMNLTHGHRLDEVQREFRLAEATKLPYEFRLFDDDGVLNYEGRSDDRESTEAFEPLDWATDYAGCTWIEYKQEDGTWAQL